MRGSQSALKWLLITFRFDMRGPVYVKGLGQRCPFDPKLRASSQRRPSGIVRVCVEKLSTIPWRCN
jgi:hypothetical protein